MVDIDRDILDHILASQPFSQEVGAQIVASEAGRITFRLELRDNHRQHHGFAHGGVIATLADNALSFATGSVVGDVVTLEFKINYMRPGIGKALIAEAVLLSHTRRQAVARAEIYAEKEDGSRKMIAAAQGTFSILTGD